MKMTATTVTGHCPCLWPSLSVAVIAMAVIGYLVASLSTLWPSLSWTAAIIFVAVITQAQTGYLTENILALLQSRTSQVGYTSYVKTSQGL